MKKYKVELSAKAQKAFRKLEKELQRRIRKKLTLFASQLNPLHYALKLKGSEKLYRFRIGDYRVIFEIDDAGEIVVLMILDIRHRKEVYEKLVIVNNK